MASSKYITVDASSADYQANKVVFPSGTFGLDLEAELSSINATFGFNKTPHRLETEWIPLDFSYSTLPTINSEVSLSVNDFYFRGKIKHADYNKSAKGKVLNIVIEDNRDILNNVYIDTGGLFGLNDTVASGVIDMRSWAFNAWDFSSRTYGLNKHEAEKEILLLEKHGTTYRNIYDAIGYYESIGKLSNIQSKLPDPDVIEAQLTDTPLGYRWSFSNVSLLDAMTTILNDVLYDFYWNMSKDKINVVNRKFAVDISENAIPISTDTSAIISSRYGKDKAENPTRVKLYGAQMEGMLGNIGAAGVFGSPDNHDLGFVPVNTYTPAWPFMKVQYWWGGAFLKEYVPDDEELKMSLVGLEQWAAYKGLYNRWTS